MGAKAGVLFSHPNQFDPLILQYQKISVPAVKTSLTALINACHKGQDLDQTKIEELHEELTYTREGRVSVESPDWAYAADLISVNITQEIGTEDNLFANGGITYELDDYDTNDGRQYQWVRANAGLTYHFNRWSKAQATYNFGMFDSNKGNIDYTVNRVMLSLSVGY